jgi:hypothetical protein
LPNPRGRFHCLQDHRSRIELHVSLHGVKFPHRRDIERKKRERTNDISLKFGAFCERSGHVKYATVLSVDTRQRKLTRYA